MAVRPVLTVPRGLPLKLRQQLLRCGLKALRDAEARKIEAVLTETDLVIEAEVR